MENIFGVKRLEVIEIYKGLKSSWSSWNVKERLELDSNLLRNDYELDKNVFEEFFPL